MTQVTIPKYNNSYFKIDHDVTLMKMKEDCMKMDNCMNFNSKINKK